MRSASPKALLATASVAVALAAADTYVVVLALTDMMAGVGVGIDALQRATPIISGFLLGYIAVLPLVGRLSDLASRQKVLLACLAVFIVGSVVTALAAELAVLVGGRVVQGAGGGGLVPATLALVADLWPADRRGTPLGIVGAVQELGSVLGPVLGAVILAVWDWRMIFWLNALAGVLLAAIIVATGDARIRRPRIVPTIVGIAALAMSVLTLMAPQTLVTSVEYGLPFVPFGDSESRVWTPIGLLAGVLLLLWAGVSLPRWWPILRRADLLGAALLGGALGCIVLTFAAADPAREVVGPLGFTLLPAAGVLLVLYLWRHRRATEPLVPRGTLRGRALYAMVVSGLVGVALVAVIVDIPVLAHLTLTDSQTEAALVLVRFLIAVPIGALVGGVLLRRFADGAVTAVGLTGTCAGLVLMGSWGERSLHGLGSWLVLIVVGFGIGLALAPVNNAALADAPQTAHGSASAMVVVARMIGMVVGLALLTAIGLHRYYRAVAELADQTDGDALLAAGIVQVQTVFFGAAVAAGLGAVIALRLGVRRSVIAS